MTLAWTPEGDLPQRADLRETVMLTFPQGRLQTVTGALRRAARRRQQPESNGRAGVDQVVWHLPQSQLPQRPPLGLMLTSADGENWIAVAVATAAGGSRWQVTARSVAVEGLLADRVHLLAAVVDKDAHGAQTAAWRIVEANVPARIQPLWAKEAQGEPPPQASRCRVILGRQRAWPLPLRVHQPHTGRTLRVLEITHEESLDQLVAMIVEPVS